MGVPECLKISGSPFSEAIAEKNLLLPHFSTMSLPQQVALKIMYGCPLSAEVKEEHGWSELDFWSMFQEHCTYDDLGFLTKVTPLDYTPKEYPEAWAAIGVRGGKSTIFAGTITAYESTCGGHEAFSSKGKPLICFQVAADLRQAKYSLHGIKGIIESMPWFKDSIKTVTSDRIDLKNSVTIAVTPPTIKAIRGYDSPVGVLDEVGVWWYDADSANPDFEIYRQLASRQAQFQYPKIVGISSAWASIGLLYDRWAAGTDGIKLLCDTCRHKAIEGCPSCAALRTPHQDRLLLHTTTAGLANPLVQRSWLQAQYNADPIAFSRECLTRFSDALSGFLDPIKLSAAVDKGVVFRIPQERNVYIAAMDPAFRHDSFAFCIGHMEPLKGVVVDLIKRWKPTPGSSINPAEVLNEIAKDLAQYRAGAVYSDQYQFEALNQLAMQLGFSILPVDFTASAKADIYGNLKALVGQNRVRLLDEPETLRELKMLEQKLNPGGTVAISAPAGQHDDLATVVALMAQKAVWLSPIAEPEVPKEPTPFDLCQAQIRRKAEQAMDDDW
jgi:hypothetical protein